MVIDSFGMGGAEKVVLTLSKGLLKSGYHVDLIILDDKIEVEVPETITMHTLGFEKGLFDYVRYERKLHALVESVDANYAEGFAGIFVHLQKATRLMRRYTHPKIFFCIHSTISMSSLSGRSGLRLAIKKRRLQKIYNNLNIIAVSDGIKDDLLEVVGVKPRSIQTIYNPVFTKEITALSKEKPSKVIEGDYIVHVGRLAQAKRHDRLLDAYAASGIEAKLLIVGEGDMRASIEQKVKEMALQEKVVLYGFSSNPYPLIAGAKLLVLCSDYEGLPTVLIEALSLGVPVVSTDCPSGPKEILRGDLKRSLVPLGDTQELAATIGRIYAEKSEPPALMRSVERFDVSTVTKEYISLLD